jgi:hypothetical protein
MTAHSTPDAGIPAALNKQFEAALAANPHVSKALYEIDGNDRERTVAAGIEFARRQTQLHAPNGFTAPGGKWAPLNTYGCCKNGNLQDPKGMFEHCKSAEHVSSEFGLKPGSATTVTALAGVLHAAKLSFRLPDELEERGLQGFIMAALNDSWRHLYCNPRISGLRPGSDEARRRDCGLKSSDEVFAERVGRHKKKTTTPSVVAPIPSFSRSVMLPGRGSFQ